MDFNDKIERNHHTIDEVLRGLGLVSQCLHRARGIDLIPIPGLSFTATPLGKGLTTHNLVFLFLFFFYGTFQPTSAYFTLHTPIVSLSICQGLGRINK